MRVSAKAEYACVALLELATSYGEPQPVRLKTMAENHGIPQRFLVQILLQLKGAGLVASLRGAAGGYQLARRPETISVAEVIDVIDRSPAARPTPLALPPSPAVRAVRGIWQQVQVAERRILEETTFADLVRGTLQGNALTYQI